MKPVNNTVPIIWGHKFRENVKNSLTIWKCSAQDIWTETVEDGYYWRYHFDLNWTYYWESDESAPTRAYGIFQ